MAVEKGACRKRKWSKTGSLSLLVLISESESLSESSVSCSGGNDDDDGALVGTKCPAVVYVTETEEGPGTSPVTESVVVGTTVETVITALAVVTGGAVVRTVVIWSVVVGTVPCVVDSPVVS